MRRRSRRGYPKGSIARAGALRLRRGTVDVDNVVVDRRGLRRRRRRRRRRYRCVPPRAKLRPPDASLPREVGVARGRRRGGYGDKLKRRRTNLAGRLVAAFIDTLTGPVTGGRRPFLFLRPVPAGEPFRLCLPTEDVAFFPEEGAFSAVFDGDLAPPWVFDAFGSPGGDGDDEATFFGVIAAR